MRSGDVHCTVNGEYVVVEQIQHEILESPVKVYNFRVADNHTYFVGYTSVGVHNANCAEPGPNSKNTKIVNGNKQANKFVEQFGYESAEAFKADIVGNQGSKFNIVYDTSTGEVFLRTVHQPFKFVETGFNIRN